MINVLFVCLGNICRSPLAEGVFMHQVYSRNLGNLFRSDSAGTASYHIGKLADQRSIAVALAYGIELNHKARAFTLNDFYAFDYIVAMDRQNQKDIQRLEPADAKAKVVLMRDYDSEQKGGEVPDPYYGEHKDFEEVYRILDRSCAALLHELTGDRLIDHS
ncbi:MAG: low molecular weight protein-tyrosine-phosphatase [Bacteroidota bacterium]